MKSTWRSSTVQVLACALLCCSVASSWALQIRIPDPLTEITDEDDPESGERKLVRLVGPRNGFCSAQVVVRGDGADRIKARLDPLVSAENSIPADAVRIRYASRKQVVYRPPGSNYKVEVRYTHFSYYDILHEEPPTGATILPLWITVRIPPDAEPGTYTGMLTLTRLPGAVDQASEAGRTEPSRIPVTLEVSAWSCPEPRNWIGHVGLLQSPESLAMRYDAPLWSERHWALMEKSMRFMSGLGNRDLFITAINRTHLGNEFAMIRFTGEADRLVPDFSIVDRYLDLYTKVDGRPTSLIVYCWDPEYRGGIRKKRPSPEIPDGEKASELPVTRVDANGHMSEIKVPIFGRPGSEATWKPVFDGLRDRVVKRGWDEGIILIGTAGDERPDATIVSTLRNMAPYARWNLYSHGRGDPAPTDGTLELDGMPVGLYELPYVPKMAAMPEDGIVGGWDLDFRVTCFPRVLIFQYSPLSQWRNMPEACVAGYRYTGMPPAGGLPVCGFTRLCFDFWDVDGRPILGRFGRHWLVRMYRRCPWAIVAPGPDGAMGTVRYEMLREGMQELQARIQIEKALLGRELNSETADLCKRILSERLRIRTLDGNYKPSPGDIRHPETQTEQDGLWGAAPGWQDLTLQLYDAAYRAVEIQP